MKIGTSMAKVSFMARGMKSAHLLLTLLIFTTLSLATSCTDYDNGFDEAMIRYNQNFIDRYGKIDPNHDWGFGEIGSVDEIGGGRPLGTRASAPGSHELVTFDKTTNKIIKLPKANDAIIPGLPSVNDGWYHVRFDGRTDEVFHFETEEELGAYMKLNDISGDALRPGGDVTDEEVLYVSRYFREHYKPGKKVALNWKDFILQGISRDWDRALSTDGKHNGERIKTRIQYFKDETNANGNEGWTLRNADEKVEFNIDQLLARPNDAPEFKYGVDLKTLGWLDINNFNQNSGVADFGNGDDPERDKNPDEQENVTFGHIMMLFLDAGTKDFAYWCSEDRTWYNNWILVPLEFDIIQTDPVCKIHKKKCEIHHYKGTYLAFDYQVHEFDQLAQGQYLKSDYDPDGYYSNYILKISAARSYDVAPDYKKRRIMCEDLGTSNDFDFNDLVFDVYYTGTKDSESKYTANITVQAAGGTLPIYIGNVDNSNEVHYILEKQTSSGGKYTPIINKGGNRTEIDIKIEGLETTNPDDIKIYVGDTENPAGKTVQLPKSEKGQYEQDGSPAPQKICLPFGTPWTDENQQIETLLLDFRDWVQDHTIDAWWKDNLNSSDDSGTSGEEEDNEGFWEDIDFTWVDGATYKEINITQGNFEKCVFYGHGSAVDVEYDEDIVDIELNTRSSILYVIGKTKGETTIKVTQKSTGKTLTLDVTVEGTGTGDIEPEGTELTIVERQTDDNGNEKGVVYSVEELNKIVGEADKVTFTIVTSTGNYHTGLSTISSDGQEGYVRGYPFSGARINKITIEKSELGNGKFRFEVSGIIAVYVEKASSVKKRTIRRK